MLHFIEESQYTRELLEIESDPARVEDLNMLVTAACTKRIIAGAWCYGFVLVSWTTELISWYTTAGTTVFLVSIKQHFATMEPCRTTR